MRRKERENNTVTVAELAQMRRQSLEKRLYLMISSEHTGVRVYAGMRGI